MRLRRWLVVGGVLAITIAPNVRLEAGGPLELPFSDTFPDVDPCTGAVHMVTISGTADVHEFDHGVVVHAERTISTDSGYLGRGNHTFVNNGRIAKLTLNDVVSHPSGDRFRAHVVLVLDLESGAFHVQKGGLTCLNR